MTKLDYESFRNDNLVDVGVTDEQQVSMRIDKPSKQEFFRVHKEIAFNVSVIKDERDRAYYLVHPTLVPNLVDDVKNMRLVLAISRDTQECFLFPLNLDAPDNSWNKSALMIAERAKTHWVRMHSVKYGSDYKLRVAAESSVEPKWPDHSPNEILNMAFGDRVITDMNHPVVRRLEGFE